MTIIGKLCLALGRQATRLLLITSRYGVDVLQCEYISCDKMQADGCISEEKMHVDALFVHEWLVFGYPLSEDLY